LDYSKALMLLNNPTLAAIEPEFRQFGGDPGPLTADYENRPHDILIRAGEKGRLSETQ
jgi:hypothetical protein